MSYLDAPCGHAPTPEEKRRDPAYLGCSAAPGEPCQWAQRFDGERNPEVHSERIENSLLGGDTPVDAAQAALDAGLV